MTRFFSTDRSWIPLFQRLVLGAVLLPHGLQKLFGVMGGYGFDATMGYFTGQLGFPALLAFVVILTESLGAVALIAGAGTRLTAFGVVSLMVGAVLTSHLGNGFFMNWDGSRPGEGFEYHLLALALAIPLVISGGGRWSVDRAIAAA
jgi:putative oxidoreductase